MVFKTGVDIIHALLQHKAFVDQRKGVTEIQITNLRLTVLLPGCEVGRIDLAVNFCFFLDIGEIFCHEFTQSVVFVRGELHSVLPPCLKT